MFFARCFCVFLWLLFAVYVATIIHIKYFAENIKDTNVAFACFAACLFGVPLFLFTFFCVDPPRYNSVWGNDDEDDGPAGEW